MIPDPDSAYRFARDRERELEASAGPLPRILGEPLRRLAALVSGRQ